MRVEKCSSVPTLPLQEVETHPLSYREMISKEGVYAYKGSFSDSKEQTERIIVIGGGADSQLLFSYGSVLCALNRAPTAWSMPGKYKFRMVDAIVCFEIKEKK